nr:ubiquitin hydrolase [Tanacetum cinerariifolium]
MLCKVMNEEVVGNKMLQGIPNASYGDPPASAFTHLDPTLGNNKWYQSLLRSFDQKKNNTQVQQSLLSWPSQRMRGLSQVEARLVEFKEQEIKFYERIRGLERDVEVRNNKIEYLTNELEEAKKDIKCLDNKLTGFENASKELENLLRSQRLDKNKEGLGYNAVPPPPAQVYSLLKKDLSWTGLPEFVDDTVTDYSRPTPSIDASSSNSSDLQSSNVSVSEHGESSSSIMSKPMIKFVKAADFPGVIKINNTKTARKSTVKYAKMYKNISKGPKVRRNQQNWNNLKSQQLGKDFLMHNKACYICGSFDHLQQVNTARPKAVINVVRRNRVNDVKASAWIKLEDSVRLNILQVKIKLLIKKLEDSEAEHQV